MGLSASKLRVVTGRWQTCHPIFKERQYILFLGMPEAQLLYLSDSSQSPESVPTKARKIAASQDQVEGIP